VEVVLVEAGVGAGGRRLTGGHDGVDGLGQHGGVQAVVGGGGEQHARGIAHEAASSPVDRADVDS
jgi:hypothetical protein